MPSKYGWLITRDHLAESDEDTHTTAGISGPRGISDAMLSDLRNGKGTAFRMYDDDEELYVSGRIIGDFDGFEPLDDYGVGGLGCTDIKYRSGNGPWRSL
jgi:hypothetical protein